MRRFLLIAVLLAVALLYGLTVATGSSSRIADYFWWIIVLCGLLMLVLAAVLVRYVLLLMRDPERNEIGERRIIQQRCHGVRHRRPPVA